MRRWHKPIPLSRFYTDRLPDTPGVFVLLKDESQLNSVLKIASTRSLRTAFQRALEPCEDYHMARPAALMYFETWNDVPEAERLLAEYRRRNGRNPVLNSPY